MCRIRATEGKWALEESCDIHSTLVPLLKSIDEQPDTAVPALTGREEPGADC